MDNNFEQFTKTILLQRRTDELQTLVRVAQIVNIIDLDRVLSETLQLTMNAVGAEKGSIFLLGEDEASVQYYITQRELPPEISLAAVNDVITNGLAGWCVKNKMGTLSEDVEKDERWYRFPNDDQDTRSALCMPIMYDKAVQGIITLVSPKPRHFELTHMQLVSAVANQVGTAIRNARLFDELQNRERQLDMVLQNTGEGLISTDANFMITLANHEAVRLLDTTSSDQVVGRSLWEMKHTALVSEIMSVVGENPPRVGSQSLEVRDERNKRDFVVTLSAIVGEQQTAGYVIIIHDITSVKDLARLKTHMLHMLTHDLKNPINIIWGYVDMLKIDSASGTPADQRFVDGIFKAVQRMETLIEDALSAERFLSAGQRPRHFRFQPADVIREAIEGLQQLANTRQQVIVEEITPDLNEIVGDWFQIREAMTNLISNAIKYTQVGGTITIRAATDEGRFYFSVEDTGMGIPADLQAELFKQFYRARRPATEGIAGTGLGLSLVKVAVEHHNGQVGFKSEEGIGSTFGFWIPLNANTNPPDSPDELDFELLE